MTAGFATVPAPTHGHLGRYGIAPATANGGRA